jgi:cysteine desulfurase
MKELESQGFEVTYLQPDGEGRITTDILKAALRKDTFLVSVMMVNNEVGSVMPIGQMAKLTHKLAPDAIFHTDAVQGFMKVPFQAKTLGADLITVSAHKVHGPKGVGALYISPRLKSFPPLIHGGGQENNYRSGTEATPAIAGFAAACAALAPVFKLDIAHEKELLDKLIASLSGLEGVQINGSHEAPHILNLSIPGVPTQNTINILQEYGICVSAGSACAKGHRSHVLTAMKLSPEIIDGSFRISLCKDTTKEELDQLVEVIATRIIPRFCK